MDRLHSEGKLFLNLIYQFGKQTDFVLLNLLYLDFILFFLKSFHKSFSNYLFYVI